MKSDAPEEQALPIDSENGGSSIRETAGIASFRNFRAHDYEMADASKIRSGILGMPPQVRAYIGYIRAASSL